MFETSAILEEHPSEAFPDHLVLCVEGAVSVQVFKSVYPCHVVSIVQVAFFAALSSFLACLSKSIVLLGQRLNGSMIGMGVLVSLPGSCKYQVWVGRVFFQKLLTPILGKHRWSLAASVVNVSAHEIRIKHLLAIPSDD